MSPNTFPRVQIPGNDLTQDQRDLMARVNALDGFDRGMKARYAFAMMQAGQIPYVRPSSAVVAERRKANKAARKARRASR